MSLFSHTSRSKVITQKNEVMSQTLTFCQAWLRIIFAEGPRQVINALTLYSVMQADLVPIGEHKVTKGHTPISQFFINIQILANHNKEQAAILFGMLFTLVIWVLYALGLLIAVLFYLLFLLNHIPSKDNGLSNYCRRKIDSRLQKIVGVKVNRALEKANTNRMLHEFNAVKRGAPGQVKRQPTLPMLDTDLNYKAHDMPSPLRRANDATYSFSMSSNSPRNEIPNSRDGESTILDIFPARPLPPSRTATQSSAFSNTTYNSKGSLLRDAAEMDYGPLGRNYPPAGVSYMRSQHSLNTETPSVDRSATLRSQNPQQSINSSVLPGGRSRTARSQSAQQFSTTEWIPSPLRSGRTPGPDQMTPANFQNINSAGVGYSNTHYEQPPIYGHGVGSAAEKVNMTPISRQNNDHRSVVEKRPPIPPRSALRALGNTAQCFALNDHRSRTLSPQSTREAATLSDFGIQQRFVDQPTPVNGRYIAFNPQLDRRPPQIKTATSAPDLARTAMDSRPPTSSADKYLPQAQQRRQQQQKFPPPRRAGTAPLPQRSDSYYDGYSMGQETVRSGTAPVHSIPPGYEYEDDNFHYITRNQTPAPQIASSSPNNSHAIWWEKEGHRFQRPS